MSAPLSPAPSPPPHQAARAGGPGYQPPDRHDIWQIRSGTDIGDLIREIFRPTRTEPLLLFSAARDTNRPRVDLTRLRDDVGPTLPIALLPSGRPSLAFSRRVTSAYRTYGGAGRILWPGATHNDAPDRHPLFVTKTEADSGQTIARIVRTLDQRGYLYETPDDPAPTSTAVEAEARIAALIEDNTALRRTVHSLTDQLDALRERLHGHHVYTDPEQQFRYEVTHHWLHTYPESERRDYPLADYTLGPDFLTSLDATEGVERDKVVACCVDVLTRRAHEFHGRQVHQVRVSDAGNAPTLVRAEDGATAWRANLQTGAPAARRLMWWDLPTGMIELAVVGCHDDYQIR